MRLGLEMIGSVVAHLRRNPRLRRWALGTFVLLSVRLLLLVQAAWLSRFTL